MPRRARESRERFSSRQAQHLQEVQTRGGGRGGLSEGDGKPGTMNADFSNEEKVSWTAWGAVTAAEQLKHLSAHPAIEPQSSVFFSHGLPSWQQSPSPAAMANSWDMAARAMPPATGSAATERAITATRMVRARAMV